MFGTDVASDEPSRNPFPQGASGSLDAWSARDWSDGIQVETCRPFEPGDLLIRGGGRFPKFRRARLVGSTAGGSALKLLGIYVGLRMEFQVDGKRLVTSSVQAISRHPIAAAMPC